MSARWWTLGVWALAAASALFWGFKLFVKAPPLPPHTQMASAAPPPAGDLTRLLGADPPPQVAAAAAEPPPDARFQLLGVVSPRSAQAGRHQGVALIAVDGKTKAFRVGAPVDGNNVLQSVSVRSATLGPRGGAALVTLNIPPPAPAATGVMPNAGVPNTGMPPPPQMPMSPSAMAAQRRPPPSGVQPQPPQRLQQPPQPEQTEPQEPQAQPR